MPASQSSNCNLLQPCFIQYCIVVHFYHAGTLNLYTTDGTRSHLIRPAALPGQFGLFTWRIHSHTQYAFAKLGAKTYLRYFATHPV